jgi:hypothetical protein
LVVSRDPTVDEINEELRNLESEKDEVMASTLSLKIEDVEK